MLAKFNQGADVVLASVYAPGGRIVGVEPWRLAASKAVSNTFRYAGGLKEIHTLSSLYRIYRAGTLRRAAETYGWLLVREPGFAANVELLLKLYNAGATVSEVPTINDWSRRLGVSKMNTRRTVVAYGRLMAAHIVGRIQPPPLSPLGAEAPAAIEAQRSGPRRLEEVA
jgi:dolichol-phosphate mannosyltransferase